MKILVVALALFSVSNANILWQQDSPQTDLDLVKDAFWSYVAKATHAAEESLTQMRESELGQQVNSKISQSADLVNHYMEALRTQVAPAADHFLSQLSVQAEQLRASVERDAVTYSESLQPYGQELVAGVVRQLEELKREVTPYAQALDPKALKPVLEKKILELKTQLDKSLVPFGDEMKAAVESNVEVFLTNVMPVAQTFEAQLSQKSQEVQQQLLQQGAELKAKMDASAQDAQAQIRLLWESFSKMSQ